MDAQWVGRPILSILIRTSAQGKEMELRIPADRELSVRNRSMKPTTRHHISYGQIGHACAFGEWPAWHACQFQR
jgi:hypothetical protein